METTTYNLINKMLKKVIKLSTKKIITITITLFTIVISFSFLFKTHLSQIRYIFSYSENIISKTEMKNFNLDDGDQKQLINNAIKQNYQIYFNGNIEQFKTLYIGKGKDNKYFSSYLKLTKDSIFIYMKTDSTRKQLSKKHSLKLTGNLAIRINQKLDSANILLTDKIDTLKISTKFRGMNSPFIRSIGSKIRVNDFTFTCDDYKNEVWVFGDSFTSINNPARWPYWVYNKNFRFFCDGLPGGKSIHSYDFFRTALTVNKPKYLIWCLGMNDGNDRFFANVSWKIYIEKIKELCEENDITLIFGIPPTCPKVNNNQKSNSIRNSGYRYIDFEKALFNKAGNWKNGYCADGVHPTEKGAKAMAEQFLKDFPEIQQYKKTKTTAHNNVYKK